MTAGGSAKSDPTKEGPPSNTEGRALSNLATQERVVQGRPSAVRSTETRSLSSWGEYPGADTVQSTGDGRRPAAGDQSPAGGERTRRRHPGVARRNRAAR